MRRINVTKFTTFGPLSLSLSLSARKLNQTELVLLAAGNLEHGKNTQGRIRRRLHHQPRGRADRLRLASRLCHRVQHHFYTDGAGDFLPAGKHAEFSK